MARQNTVEIRITGDDFTASLRKMNPKFNPGKFVTRTLVRSGQLIQVNTQTKTIRRGGKGPPLPDSLTSRTGTLRRGQHVNTVSPTIVDVGTDIEYGPVHEQGGPVRIPAHTRRGPSGKRHTVKAHTARFPPRKFLEPAVKLSRPGMGKIMNEEWTRAARLARTPLPPGGKVAR